MSSGKKVSTRMRSHSRTCAHLPLLGYFRKLALKNKLVQNGRIHVFECTKNPQILNRWRFAQLVSRGQPDFWRQIRCAQNNQRKVDWRTQKTWKTLWPRCMVCTMWKRSWPLNTSVRFTLRQTGGIDQNIYSLWQQSTPNFPHTHRVAQFHSQ